MNRDSKIPAFPRIALVSQFGDTVAELSTGQQADQMNLRRPKPKRKPKNFPEKWPLAMARDIRVNSGQVGYRLHNMRTLARWHRKKRPAYRQETLEILRTISPNRLGHAHPEPPSSRI